MKRIIPLILLAVLVAAGAIASAPPPRYDAFELLKAIKNSKTGISFPDEYKSFVSTIENAENSYNRGEVAEADQMFSLAILKGRLLLSYKADEKQNSASIAQPAAKPVFTTLSSAGQIIPAEPALQPEPSPFALPVDETSDDDFKETTVSDRIIGGNGIYIAQKKETLRLVASKLGVRQRDLARMNRLKPDASLFTHQKLRYNNRRIVPKTIRNGIVVNIPDRSLYLFRNGRVCAIYPVALGISKKKERTVWRTPVGKFQIIDKKENPTWRIPPSIQKEMEENGEEVLETVPPGPKNPLGRYAMRTTLSGILIHSTTRPASINSYSSHGCIRVMPEHMEKLFREVSVPMNGEIIYQPVKVEVTEERKVFLEVNNDSYEYVLDIPEEVNRLLKKHRATGKVSREKVNRAIKEKTGIAMDVTLDAMPE
ncbi:MAG TPA: L,D-transpeptidase family protein [Geobacteraceae bacterium]|nr:L,D-transpeptidase family protein [Geobacteraceae bacterium]